MLTLLPRELPKLLQNDRKSREKLQIEGSVMADEHTDGMKTAGLLLLFFLRVQNISASVQIFLFPERLI